MQEGGASLPRLSDAAVQPAAAASLHVNADEDAGMTPGRAGVPMDVDDRAAVESSFTSSVGPEEGGGSGLLPS